MQHLAIGTPFYRSVDTLEQYFTALTQLDYAKRNLSLYWTVQGHDETWNLLSAFKRAYAKHYKNITLMRSYKVDGAQNATQAKIMNISAARNIIRQRSDPHDLLFIDSDIFPPRNCIQRLLEGRQMGADIISGVYPYCLPLDIRRLGFSATIHHGDQGLTMQDGDIYFDAGLMGTRQWIKYCGMGLSLIRRRVLDKLMFMASPELIDSYWGEDTYFCKRADKLGFRIMADYGLFAKHWGFDLQFLGPPVDGKLKVACNMRLPMLQRRKFLDNTATQSV